MDILGAIAALVLITAILNVVPYYAGRRFLLYSIRKYHSLVVPAYARIRQYRLFGRQGQEIEISGDKMRLVDWDGVTCPVRAEGIRYVHFYQERSSKGRREWRPYVTLYSRASGKGRYARHGRDRGRGCDGVQLINNMQITVKDYVLLRKYCRQENIPVCDDYAPAWQLPLCG